MSYAASQYRNASILSEEPSMMTLVQGIRGLRTYLARAARATELGKTEAKIAAVARASELLTFLQGITASDDVSPLGQRLSGLYTTFQLRLTAAHGGDDVAGFRALQDQLLLLERELTALAER